MPMPQVRIAKRLVLAILPLFLVTACASSPIEWDGDRTSVVKEFFLGNDTARAGVWFEVRDEPHDGDVLSALGFAKGAVQPSAITQFMGLLNIESEVATAFKEQSVFQPPDSNGSQELLILLEYGLSDDLQVAGMHASVFYSQSAKTGELGTCKDEFEVMALTGIPTYEESLMVGDFRLSENAMMLRALFVNLSRDVAALSGQFYSETPLVNSITELGKIDVLTYDNRLLQGVVSGVVSPKVIAYRDRHIENVQCNTVHFLAFDRNYRKTLLERARDEKRVLRRKASEQKFKSDQQQRNQQLLYQRMNSG